MWEMVQQNSEKSCENLISAQREIYENDNRTAFAVDLINVFYTQAHSREDYKKLVSMLMAVVQDQQESIDQLNDLLKSATDDLKVQLAVARLCASADQAKKEPSK